MKNKLKKLFFSSFILLGFFLNTPSAYSHTKGISLSKYGLIDSSWSSNITYGLFSDYENGFNALKLGERHFSGLNLTSFDFSFTQDVPIFPIKWALFTAWSPSGIAIEESFLLFHKLPAQLQLKTGIFRVNFTKINQYHDHEWSFADPPLVSTYFLGVDGVHSLGAELNWQPPTPFFTELSISAMQNPVGTIDRTFPGKFDIVQGGIDLNHFTTYGRAVTYFDLDNDNNIEIGLSGAIGQNKPNELDKDISNPKNIKSSKNDNTILGGFDFTYIYKPNAFDPYIRWTSEFMIANRTNPIIYSLDREKKEVNTPLEERVSKTLMPSDLIGGFYSEINYRFLRNWDISGRFDYLGIPKGNDDTQMRLTTGLRYFIDASSRINLQYEYTLPSGKDSSYHTVFLQLNIGGGTVTPGLGKFYTLF